MNKSNIHAEGDLPQAPLEGSQGSPRKIDQGGPAFPTIGDVSHNPDWITEEGMTLRDYFAAKAMAALITDPERADQSREECARLSYLMADAMIAARGVPHVG